MRRLGVLCRQDGVNGRQDGVKIGGRRPAEVLAGGMSVENGLLVLAVVAVAIYLLAALIRPERF